MCIRDRFTTISIALVSVGLGLRLVEGQLDFATAFFILLIAPEFYQPLRSLGGHFHTSLNTREAAADIFAFLNQPVITEAAAVDSSQQEAILLHQVTVTYPLSLIHICNRQYNRRKTLHCLFM